MPFEAILHEVEQLRDVSRTSGGTRVLHPRVSEALLTISGSVCNAATILGVLVATKMTRPT
jgi:hypothetical protein